MKRAIVALAAVLVLGTVALLTGCEEGVTYNLNLRQLEDTQVYFQQRGDETTAEDISFAAKQREALAEAAEMYERSVTE